jgi:hypothetical protein
LVIDELSAFESESFWITVHEHAPRDDRRGGEMVRTVAEVASMKLRPKCLMGGPRKEPQRDRRLTRQTEPRSYSIGRLTRQCRQPFDINNISIGCYRPECLSGVPRIFTGDRNAPPTIVPDGMAFTWNCIGVPPVLAV